MLKRDRVWQAAGTGPGAGESTARAWSRQGREGDPPIGEFRPRATVAYHDVWIQVERVGRRLASAGGPLGQLARSAGHVEMQCLRRLDCGHSVEAPGLAATSAVPRGTRTVPAIVRCWPTPAVTPPRQRAADRNWAEPGEQHWPVLARHRALASKSSATAESLAFISQQKSPPKRPCA